LFDHDDGENVRSSSSSQINHDHVVVDDNQSTGEYNHLEDGDHRALLSPDNDHDGSFNHDHDGLDDHLADDLDNVGLYDHLADDLDHVGLDDHLTDDLDNVGLYDHRADDLDDHGLDDHRADDLDHDGNDDDETGGRDDHDASTAASKHGAIADNDGARYEHHDVVDPAGHRDHGDLSGANGSDDGAVNC
jgi:hypothetical protein